MKNFVLLLTALLVFLTCGVFGFLLASRFAGCPDCGLEVLSGKNASLPDTQREWLVIQTDQIGGKQATLLSIWFVLLNTEYDPPLLVFDQLYPGTPDSKVAPALEKSFALTAQGEPVAAFWKVLERAKLPVTNYIIVDTLAFEQIVTWLDHQDGVSLPLNPFTNQPDLTDLIEKHCVNIPNLKLEDQTLKWHELIPLHFHTNMQLDTALLDWQEITRQDKPVDCHVIRH